MSTRVYKTLLLVTTVILLVVSSNAQRSLNKWRDTLGFTRNATLKNAPPVLVLTTQVLGGFRGLIANALWVRAMELQENDRYFEMVQLADWITKLQPHINTVWIVQAWNMSYNISIKFSEPADRWQWVKRGIELLRDEALKFNPHEVLLYRELAWHFQHKMGHNLDDAHMYFKNVWAHEMEAVFGGPKPDFEALINPQTDDARKRAGILREKYKMDPAKMKQVEERYGPLEWRLPESHAIYWANIGRENARTKNDLIQLRRGVYQSMQLAFHRGRLIETKIEGTIRFGPNLDIIPKVNATYEEMMAEDAEMRDHISIAHRNFLLDSVYFLYTYNRTRDAQKWFDEIKKRYPDRVPQQASLVDYVLSRLNEDVGETDMNRITAHLSGLLSQAYYNLALGDDDQYQGLFLLAKKVHERYQGKILKGPSAQRVGLPAWEEFQRQSITNMLDPDRGLQPVLAAQLRTALGLPAATPPTGTNATPEVSSGPAAPSGATNAPAQPPK